MQINHRKEYCHVARALIQHSPVRNGGRSEYLEWGRKEGGKKKFLVFESFDVESMAYKFGNDMYVYVLLLPPALFVSWTC